MADDLLFGNIGQFSGPVREWRNRAQGTMLQVALGSGAVEATYSASAGWLKGLFVTTYNTPILVLLDAAATMHVLGSGGLTPGWVPCLEQVKTSLIVQKKSGTAETVYALFGTSVGAGPFV